MFFCRNDGRFLSRARKRVRSPLGAVFSEFALLAPVLLILISGIIEFAGFWDARIMANHAAWTVGRIAMVRGSDFTVVRTGTKSIDDRRRAADSDGILSDKILSPISKYVGGFKNLQSRGQLATFFLMSTCQMGFYGGTPAAQSADAITKALLGPVKKMFEEMSKSLKLKLSEWVLEEIGRIFGKGAIPILGDIVKRVVNAILKPILDALFRPIEEIIGETITAWLREHLAFIDRLLLQEGTGARRARQFVGAAIRMGRTADVVQVKEVKEKRPGITEDDCWYYERRMEFPLVFANGAQSDGYKAKGYTGWPPNSQVHSMYTVKVSWPYSTGWLFPVVSGVREGKVSPVRAVGMSYVLPSVNLEPEHLDSVNPVKFEEGAFTNRFDNLLKDLVAKLKDHLALSAFAFKYRLVQETVSIYDYKPSSAYVSDKHLMPIVQWYGFPRDHDDTYDARGKFKSEVAYGNPSYLNSWLKITGFSDSGYYHTFWHKQKTCLKAIENYRDKIWFCWPGGNSPPDDPVRSRYDKAHYDGADVYRRLSEVPSNAPFFTGKGGEWRGVYDRCAGADGRRAILLSGIWTVDAYFNFFRSAEAVRFATSDTNLVDRAGDLRRRSKLVFDKLKVYAREMQERADGRSVGKMLIPDGVEKIEYDPKKFRAWAQAKLDKIINESTDLYRHRIDPGVVTLQRTYRDMKDASQGSVGRFIFLYPFSFVGGRGEMLEHVQHEISLLPGKIPRFASLSDADAKAALFALMPGIPRPSYDPLRAETRHSLPDVERTFKAYDAALEEVFKWETNYAALLGSETAAEWKGKKIDDLDPGGKHEELKQDIYGKSSLDAGNDDDLVGDHFRHEKGKGWISVP